MRDARAIRASAAADFGLGNLRNEGFRRDESLRRSEETMALYPRIDETRTQAFLIRTYAAGGILSIGTDYFG